MIDSINPPGSLSMLGKLLKMNNLNDQLKRDIMSKLLKYCSFVSGSIIATVEQQSLIIVILSHCIYFRDLCEPTCIRIAEHVMSTLPDIRTEYFYTTFGKYLIFGLLKCDNIFQLNFEKTLENLIDSTNSLLRDRVHIERNISVLMGIFEAMENCGKCHDWYQPLALILKMRNSIKYDHECYFLDVFFPLKDAISCKIFYVC